jgi:DNA replication protein DnaC
MNLDDLAHVQREQRHCETHGEYESCSYAGGRHWTGCPSCADAARRANEEAAELKRRAHSQRVLIEGSGIVGRFLQASLANYQTSTEPQQCVLSACEQFVEQFPANEGEGLLLLGRPGTGKTHLVCGIALEIIARHMRLVHVASATDIVRQLRNTWRRGSEEREEDVIERFASYALLALDEVGVGFGTDGERSQLFEVLDLRYRLQRPVLVCSNLNATDLREALGERAFDRLQDGARVLTLGWASARRRAA